MTVKELIKILEKTNQNQEVYLRYKKIKNMKNKCENCHDMILYLDEECPDCGRKA
jgi:uncharacterized OB-fold protein